MTPEIGMYILGAALVPFVGGCVHAHYTMSQIKKDVSVLVKMERNEELTKCITENTRAITSLVHYIQWLSKHTTGLEPPPPIEDK